MTAEHDDKIAEATRPAIVPCVFDSDIKSFVPAYSPRGVELLGDDAIAPTTGAGFADGMRHAAEIARDYYDPMGSVNEQIADAILASIPSAPSPTPAMDIERAFEIGFCWALHVHSDAVRDSRDVCRTLGSDLFRDYGVEVDSSKVPGFASRDDGIVAAKRAILSALVSFPTPAREREVEAVDASLLEEAWGALNFILAFYEPGQRHLDTNAWTQAEASGRRVHAKLRAALDALRSRPALAADPTKDLSAVEQLRNARGVQNDCEHFFDAGHAWSCDLEGREETCICREWIREIDAAITTLSAGATTSPGMVGKEGPAQTKCPIGLEHNHTICSAGYCDVCQADLRLQLSRAYDAQGAAIAALRPFAELADEIESCCKDDKGNWQTTPDQWSKSCAWDDLVRARAILTKLKASS